MLKRILLALFLLVVAALASVGVWYARAVGGLDPAALEAEYLSSADQFIMIDDVRVRVRVEGDAGAPAIVLLHGFSYSLESWDAWAADLARDHRVVRFDFPAHGLTGPDPQARYEVTNLRDFVFEVMDELDIERAHVAGNSLGGLVAWRVAAARPSRVDRLVLIAPGGFSINGVTDEPVEVPGVMRGYLKAAPASMVRTFTAASYGDPSQLTDARLKTKRDMMRRRGNGDALIATLEVFTLPDPRPDLARVTAPTLLMWGGKDRVVPPDHQDRFLAVMPNASAVRFKELGHTPHEEDPEETLRAARAFLYAQTATPQEVTP